MRPTRNQICGNPERFGFSPGQFSSECYYFGDCNVGIDTLSSDEALISKR